MVKITLETDCGNSPKRETLKEFNTAFAENNTDKILSLVTDDIVWDMLDDAKFEGKEAFKSVLIEMANHTELQEMIISKVIVHGKEGAVSGMLVMADDRRYHFCDVYEFENAKGERLKSIKSFIIEEK